MSNGEWLEIKPEVLGKCKTGNYHTNVTINHLNYIANDVNNSKS